MRSERGFTLIELLTVLSIIGILAGLSIQSFKVYRSDARHSVAEDTLRNAREAVEASILGTESSLPAIGLTQQMGPGEISGALTRQVLQGMILPANVKLAISYDPACNTGACQSEFVQVNHCSGDKFARWIRLGDGTNLFFTQLPRVGCP